MDIRDTEGTPASFRTSLFAELGIHELQGILMNTDWEPTAGVEAIDYNDDEEIDVITDLGEESLRTKLTLTDALDVPLYVITSYNAANLSDLRFEIHKISYETEIRVSIEESSVTPERLAEFWANLKGTTSQKDLPDADVRISNSNVDNVLRKADLEWGGNVDGVLTNKAQDVRAIIECRKTRKSELRNYDPDDYFHYRGGDYNTWRPLYNIADELNVPLVLLTFKRGENLCGCAYIEDMDKSNGLYYRDDITPDQNLLNKHEAVSELNDLN